MAFEIKHGDCLEVMRGMADNSVDAIVTDPPYGLSFMGKKWDYDVPEQAVWEECLRVLKPGGHLLAFAGTRTQHRMAVRIEDAGFEIRDMIAWVYGSGFPKSHNIAKAIDREAGERGAVGKRFVAAGGELPSPERNYVDPPIVLESARKWQGWSTALKPSYEPLTLARKPLDIRTHCVYLAQYLTSQLCQYSANVKDADPSSTSSPSASDADPSASALWTAVGRCNTPGDLFALMDTLPSGSVLPSTLSTVFSWLRTLDGLLQHESTFTTETASSLTTDLKTLNSLLLRSTQSTTIAELTEPSGRGSSAELVACIFNGCDAYLRSTLARFVHGNAIAKAQENYRDAGVSPSLEPITVARKPLVGTVAANVLAHGTGALNIDGCRVPTDENLNGGAYAKNPTARDALWGDEAGNSWVRGGAGEFVQPPGRWPANLIHDGSDEVVACFPDTGSAARFFYCAKASKEDRDEGLTSLPLLPSYMVENGSKTATAANGVTYERHTLNRNAHPTVKPTDLMRWLVRLVTPPGGIVLDPFCGSGSTGKAAMLEGFRFIGIEREEASAETARLRVAHAEATPVQLDMFAPAAPMVAPPANDRQFSFDL